MDDTERVMIHPFGKSRTGFFRTLLSRCFLVVGQRLALLRDIESNPNTHLTFGWWVSFDLHVSGPNPRRFLQRAALVDLATTLIGENLQRRPAVLLSTLDETHTHIHIPASSQTPKGKPQQGKSSCSAALSQCLLEYLERND